MKSSLILIVLLLSAAVRTQTARAQAELRPARVEFIDFYGYGGLDADKVRAALPVHEGETFPTLKALDAERPRIEEAVRRVTGRPPTEVSFVSPGVDAWLIYVGLSGDTVESFPYNPAPKGKARLPAAALDVYRQTDAAFLSAMQRGASGEDDSKGYALSRDDATLRAKQLAMHEYAARREDVIRAVLRSAADTEQQSRQSAVRPERVAPAEAVGRDARACARVAGGDGAPALRPRADAAIAARANRLHRRGAVAKACE